MLDDRESLLARRSDILKTIEMVESRAINLEVSIRDFLEKWNAEKALAFLGKPNKLDTLKAENTLLIERKEELENYYRLLKISFNVVSILLRKLDAAPVVTVKPVMAEVNEEAVNILMGLTRFVEATRVSKDSRSLKRRVYATYEVALSQASEETKEYIRNEIRYQISERS